jgi:hypothetical protein
VNQDLSEIGAKHLLSTLVHLEKYKNLNGVKCFIEEFEFKINKLKRCYGAEYPKLPPISEIPLDDLLNELKRRVEYHPGPIG